MIPNKKGVFYPHPGETYPCVNRPIIEELIKHARDSELKICRYCLHENEDSKLMAMLIVIMDKYIYPAHRHAWKDESYSVLEGSCIFREYRDPKSIAMEQEIDEGGILFNNRKRFHTIVPNSNILVFVEHTEGPFTSQKIEYYEK